MTDRENFLMCLKQLIHTADAMRNSYWFRSPSSAAERRSYEKRHTHERIEWSENGHTYTAEYHVSCSVNNVYARGVYTRDGQRTTLTAIKNSYKRMIGVSEE